MSSGVSVVIHLPGPLVAVLIVVAVVVVVAAVVVALLPARTETAEVPRREPPDEGDPAP